jgi:ABC-type branched-subunit amino acid transport system ATPase component/ABC-type branched-subunit amino acid transport system permease subunit
MREFLIPGSRPFRRPSWIYQYAAIVVVAVVVLAIAYSSGYWSSLVLQGALYAMLSMALNLVAGFGGRLAFGNVLFFGLGAYIVAIGVSGNYYPALAGLAGALVICGILAYLLGFALWRLGGLMFALGTFAIANIVYQLVFLPSSLIGSGNGLQENLPQGASLLGLTLTSNDQFVTIGVILVIIIGLGTRAFVSRRWGLLTMAVRDDRVAASTCGIDGRRLLALVWAASAMISALAGVFYLQSSQFIDPDTAFGSTTATLILLPMVVGGMGTLWGPALGAVIIPLGLYVNRFSSPNGIQSINNIVYAAVLILIVRLAPGGLVRLWRRVRPTVSTRLRTRTAAGDQGPALALAAATVRSDRAVGGGVSPGTQPAGSKVPAVAHVRTGSHVPKEQSAPVGPAGSSRNEGLGIPLAAEDGRHGAGPGQAVASGGSRPAGSVPRDSSPALRVKGVSRSFGGLKAVSNVTFDVSPGEVVGLVGPNGAGKSTLFNCVTGVIPIDGGTIELRGKTVSGLPPFKIARAGISRTYQTVRLFQSLTVAENLRIPQLAMRSRASQTAHPDVDRLLGLTGLSDHAGDMCKSLTLIDQRRTELARAIAGNASVVLLDEVLTGLEAEEARDIGATIRELASSSGTAFIVVEHVMGTLLPMIDRLIVMDAGSVIADGHPDEVMRSEAVLAAYFGGRRYGN